MTCFLAYVLSDVVEVEPVYFPSRAASKADVVALSSSSSASSSSPAAAAAATRRTYTRGDGNTNIATTVNEDPHSSVTCLSSSTSTPYTLTFDDVLLHRVTERYVGKVIPAVGLCVAVVRVLAYSPSEIKGPAASAWVTATFEVCVFAPTTGERLRAHIAHQDHRGLFLSVDFFAAMPFVVPATQLVAGSLFDRNRGSWYLPLDDDGGGAAAERRDQQQQQQRAENDDDGGGGDTTRNYYVVGEDVVVKVLQCIVRSELEVREGVAADVQCGHRSLDSSGADGGSGGLPQTGAGNGPGPLPLMEIVGSFVGDGLGPTAWFEETLEGVRE